MCAGGGKRGRHGNAVTEVHPRLQAEGGGALRVEAADHLRDAELANLISQVRAEVRGIYGVPKVHMRLCALGIRTSRKRGARIMRDHGVRPSVGSVGSPWDNAAIESLMGIIKSEGVHAQVYGSCEEAALDLFEYIECVYNRVRTHLSLGYLSPMEFEERNWPKNIEEVRSEAD